MSTTMLSASSAVRRNVASTTNVAPCIRCAGPNTSPRKLWATITWSRTVTLNTASALLVGDQVAEGRLPAVGQRRQDVRELRAPRRAGEQDVEGRVAEQFERQRQAVAGAAGVPPGRSDPPDLARPNA